MEKALNKINKYNLLLMKSNCLYMETGGKQKIIAEPSKSNFGVKTPECFLVTVTFLYLHREHT